MSKVLAWLGTLDASTWAAIVSAITAVLAAVVAWWSARVAKESLELTKLEREARKPRLSLYLQNGYTRTLPTGGSRLFAVSIAISNVSDMDNSISRVELVVRHHRGKGPLIDLLLPHDPALGPAARIKAAPAAVFAPPLSIPAHQTVAGWTLFELHDKLMEGASVDGYVWRLTDTHGLEYEAHPNVFTEIVDEREMAQG